MFYVIFLVSSSNREVRPRHLSQLKMSKGKCPLCEVQWKPKSSDIWGPSITSLNEMPIKMQSHVLKPFKEASVDYTNKYVLYLNCEGVNVVKLPAIPFCNFATLITSPTYYSVSKAIEGYKDSITDI